MKNILILIVALLVLVSGEYAQAFGPGGEGKKKAAEMDVSPDEVELVMEMNKFFETKPTEMMWFVQAWDKEDWVFKNANLYGNAIVRQFAKTSDSPHGGEVTDTLLMEAIYKTKKEYPGITAISFTTVPSLKNFMTTYTGLGKEQCESGFGTEIVSENNKGTYPSMVFTTSCSKYKESGLPGASLNKIVKGKHGIYHISRARAAGSLDKEKVEAWSKGFAKINLCDNKVKGQNCPKSK